MSSTDTDASDFSDDGDALVDAHFSATPEDIAFAQYGSKSEDRSTSLPTMFDRTQDTNLANDVETFRYPAMSNAKAQVRLLYVAPGFGSDSIVCKLRTWVLGTEPQYCAISYTWGDPDASHVIFVNDVLLPVHKHCWHALWQVRQFRARHPLLSAYFWIDAVCINQHELTEKSDQVGLLGTIFQKANCVLACMEPHEDDTKYWNGGTGEAICKPDTFQASKNPSIVVKRVQAMRHLGERGYWQRVWVLQEVLLASNVFLLCGEESVKFDDDDFISAANSWRYTPNPPFMWELMTWLVEGRDVARAKQQRTLSGLLAITSQRLCSDPRDRVFGILSLLDPAQTPFVADYTLSRMELAARVLQHLDLDDYQAINETASKDLAMNRLCATLALRLDDPETAQWIRQRPLPQVGDITAAKTVPRRQVAAWRLCTIHKELGEAEKWGEDFPLDSMGITIWSAIPWKPDGLEPRKASHNVGIRSGVGQTGDVVAALRDGLHDTPGPAFLLRVSDMRQFGVDKYDHIGWAIGLDSCFEERQYQLRFRPRGDFEFHVDVQDWFLQAVVAHAYRQHFQHHFAHWRICEDEE